MELAHSISGVVPLMWREHCLECAMPLCYKTCDLYKKRMDGRCVRFEHGIVPYGVDGAEIEFRRWAKLQCDFIGLCVRSVAANRRWSRLWSVLSSCTRGLCDLIDNYRLCQIEASLSERINSRLARRRKGRSADGFLAIIKADKNVKLLLEASFSGVSCFKTGLDLKPGWNECYIPIAAMNLLDKDVHSGHLLAYLEDNDSARLIFKCFDLVAMADVRPDAAAHPAAKVKCVAWDLDNTLWDGVIGDVGPDNVKIRSESVALIKALDERGILQTIASKNTYDVAWPKIQEIGLADYFLYPAINWGRKSGSLKEVASALNINIDTFALIDDSSFERSEVSSTLPQVRVYDVVEVPELLDRSEFDVPITEASRGRRQTYMEEAKRKQIKAAWSGDYDSFLKSCQLKMEIFKPAGEADFKRCLELVNRSNQYNISGKRYTREELDAFLATSSVSAYGFRVSDQYGDYGVVGFVTLQRADGVCRIVDFVMSCRVAMKKIERAFVGWLQGELPDDCRLVAEVRKTDRNKPLQEVFRTMPIAVKEDSEQVLSFEIDGARPIADGVVEVVAK